MQQLGYFWVPVGVCGHNSRRRLLSKAPHALGPRYLKDFLLPHQPACLSLDALLHILMLSKVQLKGTNNRTTLSEDHEVCERNPVLMHSVLQVEEDYF